jgi:hypothetical protein
MGATAGLPSSVILAADSALLDKPAVAPVLPPDTSVPSPKNSCSNLEFPLRELFAGFPSGSLFDATSRRTVAIVRS